MSTPRGRGYSGRHQVARPGHSPISSSEENAPKENKINGSISEEETVNVTPTTTVNPEPAQIMPFMVQLKIISPEDELSIAQLLYVDAKYRPVVSILESFKTSDDGIAFNNRLRELESLLMKICKDERELDMAFASMGAAAMSSVSVAKQLAMVGAALSRLQSNNVTKLRTALLNLMQALFMKVEVMERCDTDILINAANLMGDYFSEARLNTGARVGLLARPLVRYLRGLLMAGGNKAHKAMTTQLMINGRELYPHAKKDLEALWMQIKEKSMSKPPTIVWLLLASDLFLLKFLPLPDFLQKFYAELLDLGGEQEGYTEVAYGAWKSENPESHNSSISSDEQRKPRPILGMGARNQTSHNDTNPTQMNDDNSSNNDSADQSYNSTEQDTSQSYTSTESSDDYNRYDTLDIPKPPPDFSVPPPAYSITPHMYLNTPLPANLSQRQDYSANAASISLHENQVRLDNISLDSNELSRTDTSQDAGPSRVHVSEDTYDTWKPQSQLAKRYDLNSWRQQSANKEPSESMPQGVTPKPQEPNTETINWRELLQATSSGESKHHGQAAKDNVFHQDGTRIQDSSKRENAPRRDDISQRQHDDNRRLSDESRRQGEENKRQSGNSRHQYDGNRRQSDANRRQSSDGKRQEDVPKRFSIETRISSAGNKSSESSRAKSTDIKVAVDDGRRHVEMKMRQGDGTKRLGEGSRRVSEGDRRRSDAGDGNRQEQDRDSRRSDFDTHGRRHVIEHGAADDNWSNTATRRENPEACSDGSNGHRRGGNNASTSRRDNNARQTTPGDVPRSGKYWGHDDRCDRNYD